MKLQFCSWRTRREGRMRTPQSWEKTEIETGEGILRGCTQISPDLHLGSDFFFFFLGEGRRKREDGIRDDSHSSFKSVHDGVLLIRKKYEANMAKY